VEPKLTVDEWLRSPSKSQEPQADGPAANPDRVVAELAPVENEEMTAASLPSNRMRRLASVVVPT
jgi:hypothetical protein